MRGISFGGWAVLGAGYGIALLGALSIGPFLLPVLVLVTVLLLTRQRFRPGWPGLISGAGVPLLVLAVVNRAGPGETCTPDASQCTELYNPWPWLLAGVALIAAGVFIERHARKAIA